MILVHSCSSGCHLLNVAELLGQHRSFDIQKEIRVIYQAEYYFMNRIIFLDYLRVIACLMVMLVHSCEPFYLGGQGTLILNSTDAMWVTLIDSAIRSSVPLFVMASSYLLFPVRDGETRQFYTRRMKRVAIPAVIWLVLYAVVPLYGEPFHWYSTDETIHNLGHLAFNFPGAAGHLWFVFMLLGIYIVMPIFSPWVERLTKRGEQWFLALWLFTTLIPYWRYFAQQYTGLNEVMGEANWNEFGLFYGVSGFMGYVVLGHYLRTYTPQLSWRRTLAMSIPLLLVGYAIIAGGFWQAMPSELPFEGPIQVAVRMELTWRFCTLGTALMTLGYFLIIRKLNGQGMFYRYVILPISKASYGMYLMHIFWLCLFVTLLRNHIESTLVVILLTAGCTYVASFISTIILQQIPIVGKWIGAK